MTLEVTVYAFSLVLALGVGLVVGLSLSRLRRLITELGQSVVALQGRKADVPEVVAPKASIIDPDDVVGQAQRDFEETRNRLNPREQ